jgi:hypothetical protein
MRRSLWSLVALSLVVVGCGGSRPESVGGVAVYAAVAGSPGSEAHELLTAAPFTTLHVEVAAAKGLEPRPAALEHLRSALSELCQKPGGVTVTLASPVDTAARVYSVDDCVALERAHRASVPLAAPVASLYVLYLPGESDRDVLGETTLGWSTSPSSFAVFAHTIDTNPPAAGTAADLEGAVLVHEACHLLGLVGHGSPELRAHEDPNHPAHCTTPGCLMSAQSYAWDLTAGGTLCPWCRADLRANGGL